MVTVIFNVQLFSLIFLSIDLFHSGHVDRELPGISLHLD